MTMTRSETDRAVVEIPIACTLTAEEQAAWGDGMGRAIFRGYEELRELPDGYALRFPGDEQWAQTILEFIVHERACCPFFTFGLVFEPNHGVTWLHLSGSADIKAFVGGMLRAFGNDRP